MECCRKKKTHADNRERENDRKEVNESVLRVKKGAGK